MRPAALLALLLVGTLGSGSLRAAGTEDILVFSEVSGRHFHALHVDRASGAPSDRILVFYVERLGDDRGADTRDAEAWLLAHLNVALLDRPGGFPIYFTKRDLVGSQGTDALGATIPTGIAVETRSPTLLGCALAHEIGHALGLRHVDRKPDIMAPRCDHGKLEWATASPEAREKVARLESIEALTVTGRVLWAHRS